MRHALAGLSLVVAAACSDATFERCSVRCTTLGGCPSGLQCLDDRFCHQAGDTVACAAIDGGDAASPDGATVDARPPANDRPENATAIIDGITVIDFAGAQDDGTISCSDGSAEVFFETSYDAYFVLYVETDGAAGLALREGSCTTPIATEIVCEAQTCQPSGVTQVATRLAGGTYCLIVEQLGPERVNLKVTRTLYGFPPLLGSPSPIGESMCAHPDDQDLGCLSSDNTAEDLQLFFPVCPGDTRVQLSTCNAASPYAPAIGLARDVFDSNPVACGSDCSVGIGQTLDANVSGPALYWVILDEMGCGDFTLNWSITGPTGV